jgi:putative flavoprotein involved in K+ transport
MQRIPALIIGAGQAGLAMSYCLTARGIDHVVLERGRVAERWHSERWDSLRLLSPNWMTRLPGWSYRGNDPDGFMTAAEFARYLQAYAAASVAPVQTGTTVQSVRRDALGFRVETDRGRWRAGSVVIATGYCGAPAVPSLARLLPAGLHQVTPSDYRNPGQLPQGGVLIVGASATGVQLADEILGSGREVWLSVGRHIRLPRRYRGHDIYHWLERAGVLDETAADIADLQRARALPSFQLVGRADGRTIDLGTLRDAGVHLLGHLAGVNRAVLQLRDDLADSSAHAHAALERLLRRIDLVADADGAPPDLSEAGAPLELGCSPQALDLEATGIRTVLWATGFRRDYGWLHVPVLDRAGEIVHDGGVTPCPGLYVLGLRLLRRRQSSFIDGVGFDAEELAGELARRLAQPFQAAA